MSPSQAVALSVNTYDAKYLVEISQEQVVLAVVAAPAGGNEITEFCVWIGDAFDKDDNERDPEFVFNVGSDGIKAAWLKAVAKGYEVAVDKMLRMVD